MGDPTKANDLEAHLRGFQVPQPIITQAKNIGLNEVRDFPYAFKEDAELHRLLRGTIYVKPDETVTSRTLPGATDTGGESPRLTPPG